MSVGRKHYPPSALLPRTTIPWERTGGAISRCTQGRHGGRKSHGRMHQTQPGTVVFAAGFEKARSLLRRTYMSTLTFVLTVDSATARIFNREGESSRGLPTLTEVSKLTRPEARLTETQRFSDSNPVGGAGGGGGGYHTFDDHRHEHELEDRRRFAQEIAQKLNELVTTPTEVIVCVTHAMQSSLSDALNRHARNAHPVWQTVEYTRLTPHELSKALTGRLAKAANA